MTRARRAGGSARSWYDVALDAGGSRALSAKTMRRSCVASGAISSLCRCEGSGRRGASRVGRVGSRPVGGWFDDSSLAAPQAPGASSMRCCSQLEPAAPRCPIFQFAKRTAVASHSLISPEGPLSTRPSSRARSAALPSALFDSVDGAELSPRDQRPSCARKRIAGGLAIGPPMPCSPPSSHSSPTESAIANQSNRHGDSLTRTYPPLEHQ